MAELLVVGYGNDLREDDGAGRAVADAVERRRLPGVTVRSAPQLSPELALDIAGKDLVVFVDADVEVTHLRREPVAAGPTDGVLSHHGDPSSLLSLAATVGDVPGEAYLISIPAENLGLGFELSARTTRAVEEAVDLIAELAAS